MKGIVITTDQKLTVQEFSSPLHKTVGAVVDGPIEMISPRGLSHPYRMFVNENGQLLDLRINPIGSWLYGTYAHGHPILGTIVIMKIGMTPDGPDIIGLTDDEIETITTKFCTAFCLERSN